MTLFSKNYRLRKSLQDILEHSNKEYTIALEKDQQLFKNFFKKKIFFFFAIHFVVPGTRFSPKKPGKIEKNVIFPKFYPEHVKKLHLLY